MTLMANCSLFSAGLKTMIRSNPGLLLLHGGTVVRKWSHNLLPVIAEEQASQPLERFEIGHLPEDSVPRKVARILLWFVLPLTLLVVADRLWMWTKWLRRHKKGNNEQGSQEIGNNPKITTKTKEQ